MLVVNSHCIEDRPTPGSVSSGEKFTASWEHIDHVTHRKIFLPLCTMSGLCTELVKTQWLCQPTLQDEGGGCSLSLKLQLGPLARDFSPVDQVV
ncbi:hypothetical protein O9929_15020 [Vibrio lentus]|nr:hypothetical protein [Vibrio lentus]